MAATTVDLRDPSYTGLHSKRVKDFAILSTESMKLPKVSENILKNAY